MSFVYKLAAFDMDGTLAPSKGAVSGAIASLLNDLSKTAKVVVISGGSFRQFEAQLIPFIEPNKNFILLPTEGAERFEYDEKENKWNMTDKEDFPDEIKKKAINALNEIISSDKYGIPPNPRGEYIDDRDTQISFAALGQQAALEEKEKWDPDLSKRRKIKEALESKVKGISASIAGTTSVDILPEVFNKAVGLNLLLKQLGLAKEDVVFVGDAIVPGGNDYSIFEAGIRTIKVKCPEETEMLIRAWINPPVAFFCSEYALLDDTAMYAGGLGILAADYVREAADQNIPFIAIGIKYGKAPLPNSFSVLPDGVQVPIGGEMIRAEVWHSSLAENVHIFLLDAGEITSRLYDPEFSIRIKQQLILGIGGVRLLKQLNIFPSVYHLNEGHTAFAGIAIMTEMKDSLDRIVATKHTILSEAGQLIPLPDLRSLIGSYCGEFFDEIFEKGKYELDGNMFSTTKFLLSVASRQNGVSVQHTIFEKKKHPSSVLIPITNGVYRKKWQAGEMAGSTAVSNEDLWNAKQKLRSELCSYVKGVTGKTLNPEVCTLIWARRFAVYKRPSLILSDYRRIVDIVNSQEFPLQIVISGKAHPADSEGMGIVEKMISFSEDAETVGRVAYLPDYSSSLALKLVQGADIWLNTPELGKEACGTSGMKSGLNGAIQCSVRDGWVGEVSLDGIGWDLPEDRTARVFYDLLEHEILPCFYGECDWIVRMRSTIELMEKSYTTKRMLEQYRKELYN
ncbi:MAG: alpha-glucan family phosphorylase [bacterium]|nr:alpha-glucan family phosphorylase [bacterium]